MEGGSDVHLKKIGGQSDGAKKAESPVAPGGEQGKGFCVDWD